MGKTIAIDEDGYFILNNGVRLSDEKTGRDMLSTMAVDEFGVSTIIVEGEKVIVEPFDKPFVVRQIFTEQDRIVLQMPYQYKVLASAKSFCLDAWDRFHGQTESGIPFVLSRPAQAELFALATDFDDESIVVGGQTIHTPDYYIQTEKVENADFWEEKYEASPSPSWNLDQPHPELKSILQQIKINKMRVLVPGCGFGHDAALLAELGHVVTAVDFSPQALDEARKRYGHIKNLEFIQGDVFDLSEDHHHAYDLILEHTCYCAITPDKRNQLIQAWSRYLAETGHLLGLFFVVPKRTGPYFGGSEWELRELLEKRFKFLYWTRAQHSPGWRQGAELILYAQIKERP